MDDGIFVQYAICCVVYDRRRVDQIQTFTGNLKLLPWISFIERITQIVLLRYMFNMRNRRCLFVKHVRLPVASDAD